MTATRRCWVCCETSDCDARGVCRLCASLRASISHYRRHAAAAHVRPYADQERDILMRALNATLGDVTEAAKCLGIGRATIYRKVPAADLIALQSRCRAKLRGLEEQFAERRRRGKSLRRREGWKWRAEKRIARMDALTNKEAEIA